MTALTDRGTQPSIPYSTLSPNDVREPRWPLAATEGGDSVLHAACSRLYQLPKGPTGASAGVQTVRLANSAPSSHDDVISRKVLGLVAPLGAEGVAAFALTRFPLPL